MSIDAIRTLHSSDSAVSVHLVEEKSTESEREELELEEHGESLYWTGLDNLRMALGSAESMKKWHYSPQKNRSWKTREGAPGSESSEEEKRKGGKVEIGRAHV